MRPEPTADSAAPVGDQRRRVRLFAALHLGAIGATYVLALIVGGGFAGPPMPPLTTAAAKHAPQSLGLDRSVFTTESSTLPDWAQRVEIARPLESR